VKARQLLDADPANQVRVFNFGDAVIAVSAGQQVPNGTAARAWTPAAYPTSGSSRAEWSAWADHIINV